MLINICPVHTLEQLDLKTQISFIFSPIYLPDHSGTPADTENYNKLLRDLRKALDGVEEMTGKFYGLTAAMPCGTSNIKNIDIPTVARYLTEFNLMTYGKKFCIPMFYCLLLSCHWIW